MVETEQSVITRSKRKRNQESEDTQTKRRRVEDSDESTNGSEDGVALEELSMCGSETSETLSSSSSDNSDEEYEDDDIQIKGIEIKFMLGEDVEQEGEVKKPVEPSDQRIKDFLENDKIPDNIKNVLREKYNQYSQMSRHASEYFKLKRWIDVFVQIPFGQYVKFPSTGKMEIDSNYLRDAEGTLNERLYGQNRAKDELMEIMTKWVINPDSRGQVIGLQGSPGVGKTELAKNCISPMMQRPFQYISLGGLTDGSYFDGHSYTYEGATHGRLVQMLIDANCMNPIIFMDELDKISESRVGQEIVGKLIHLTDPTQNDTIMDKYFTGVPFDFSKALIIFSYNDERLIDRVLLNRIRTIKMDDFNTKDKVQIANNYLLPKLCTENMINVKFSERVMKHIIHKNNEPGVRGLKSDLENIIMKLNVVRMLPEKQPTITVSEDMTFNMDMYHKLYKAYPSDIDNISNLMMYV